MFQSYKKEKYSPLIKYGDNRVMGRMCKNCGYPYGPHYGPDKYPTCPDGNKYPSPSYPPVFYIEKLHPNIKVL